MALRDQPYLPLYIQDFMTDEKLIECSAEATGVYIRLMCIMHKSEQYGKILLKQKDKQSTERLRDFALKLVRHMPYTFEVIYKSLLELMTESVLTFDGDYLVQKRMVSDNLLSLTRAESGSKGGKVAQAKIKAKHKANTEYEYVNETDIENKLKGSFDEIYLDQEKMKWKHIDFDFEFRTFCDKVRGSPEHYAAHDTGGIRLALQSQLRNSKSKNGNSRNHQKNTGGVGTKHFSGDYKESL